MAYETVKVDDENELSVPKGTNERRQIEDATDVRSADELLGKLAENKQGSPNSDPVAAQSFGSNPSNNLTDTNINALMDTTWIAPRIVEQFAEFATRSGAEIDVKSNEYLDDSQAEELSEAANDWLDSRDIMTRLESQIEEERATGDGVIIPITREISRTGKATFKKPLAKNIISIESFNIIGADKIKGFELNKDPLSPEYNELQFIEVRDFLPDGSNTGDVQKIHPSRFTHLRSRQSRRNPEEGLSVFRRMVNILKALVNAEWSVGQVIFSMVFKVLKTDLSGMSDRKQHKVASRLLEKHLNALTLAVVDKDEEFSFEGSGQGVQGIEPVFNFLKELLAGATHTPKSILFGQQQGEVTGSEKDQQNYFTRISGFQDTWLTPELRYIVDLGLRARDEIYLPFPSEKRTEYLDKIEYGIEWAEIFEGDEKEKAEIDKIKEETKQVRAGWLSKLLQSGVIGPQQAAQEFNSEDTAAFKEAKRVTEKIADKYDLEIPDEN